MECLISKSSNNHLNNFIIAAKQYLQSHDESSLNAILCTLQILGQPSDLFDFNSKNKLLLEFYVNLCELMNNTNDDSDLMWAAINVLYSISKQGFFHNSLPNNHKFSLILTKLLKDHLSSDRKIKLLKLLQELTYGVKLQCQEAYLSELIILLVKWISSGDKDLTSLSLGVLVNVFSKNKFAMFTLLKSTDSKPFMRLLLRLQSDYTFTKVQVYKLLLVLEHVCGQIPHTEVNNLIDLTFIVLEEGLNQNNIFALRHTIDFFIDISKHLRWKNYVLEYSNYQSKINSIMESMKNCKPIEKSCNSHNNYDVTLKSVGLTLQFIHHVIQLKIEDFIIIYPNIIINVLHWAQFLDIHEQALSLLHTIIMNVRINYYIDQNLQNDIFEKLAESLNVLLNLLFDPNHNNEKVPSIKSWNQCAISIKLLQEMLKMPNLYEQIEEKLTISFFQSIFHSLLLIDIKDINNLQNITFVYIEALYFLSDLVAKNPKWMSLYSEVLNQKHVYCVLAFIIYNGPKNMKQKVLDLVTKFSQQSILMLSDCLEEFEQLSSTKVKYSVETEIKPLCSFAQEEQLQTFIDELENMFNSNDVLDIKTSNVIKLYQNKIQILKQSEVWLKQSLNNASEEMTQLNYKIIDLNNESMVLNNMLLENHQTIDELTMENIKLKQKLNDITEKYSITSNDFAKLSRNYETKRQIIQELNLNISNLDKKLEEQNIASNHMKSSLLDQLQNEKTENKIQVSKLEQQLIDKQNIISEKTEEIDSKMSFIRNLEKNINEKDKDNLDLRKQLHEQHKIHEMISQMLAATSSKPQL